MSLTGKSCRYIFILENRQRGAASFSVTYGYTIMQALRVIQYDFYSAKKWYQLMITHIYIKILNHSVQISVVILYYLLMF